jgi:hypothetical protein
MLSFLMLSVANMLLLSIRTLSIRTLCIRTISLRTLRIRTLGIKVLFNHKDTKHNRPFSKGSHGNGLNGPLSTKTLGINSITNAECCKEDHCAECPYADRCK